MRPRRTRADVVGKRRRVVGWRGVRWIRVVTGELGLKITGDNDRIGRRESGLKHQHRSQGRKFRANLHRSSNFPLRAGTSNYWYRRFGIRAWLSVFAGPSRNSAQSVWGIDAQVKAA